MRKLEFELNRRHIGWCPTFANSRNRVFKKLAVCLLTFFVVTIAIPVRAAPIADEQPASLDVVRDASAEVDSTPIIPVEVPEASSAALADDAPQGTAASLAATTAGDAGANSNLSEPARSTQRAPEVDDNTGALIYKIPIQAPPGRSGLQPDFAIQYNSQSRGRGSPFGLGWSVPLPSIQRLNKYGLLQLYSRNDFVSSLSGELVDIGLGTFAARSDSGDYLAYTFSGGVWSVKDARGTVYSFGSTTSSRQSDPADPTNVFRWYVDEVIDANGNKITYTYASDQGQVYPARIVYTGSGLEQGPFAVDFTRALRATPHTDYSTGFAVRTAYHISEIAVSVVGTWARKYTLAYSIGSNTGDELLTQVVESGRAEGGVTTVLPPITLTYQADDLTTSNFRHTGFTSPIDAQYDRGGFFADVNGDGLSDVMQSYTHEEPNGLYVWDKFAYINNGIGAAVSNPALAPPAVAYQQSRYGPGRDMGLRATDINSDGHTDILQYSGAPPSSSYLGTGVGWVQNDEWQPGVYLISCGQDYCRAYDQVELNGDGLVDFIRTSWLWNGTTYVPDTLSYENQGPGWLASSTRYKAPIVVRTEEGGLFGDVNGDGLSDILKSLRRSDSLGTEYIIKAYLSNGRGQWIEEPAYAPPVTFFNQPQWGPGVDFAPRLIDFNGDGLNDLTTSDGAGSVQSFINTGNGWAPAGEWNPEVPMRVGYYNNFQPFSAVELNGDGINDYIRTSTIWNGTSYDPATEVRISNEKPIDVLIGVTYPTGGRTDIAYSWSAQQRASGSLLNPNLPSLIMVVANITTNVGVLSTEQYKYAGGEYYYGDPRDRKFAGFGNIVKTDAAGNTTTTYYHQGNGTNSALGEAADHFSKIGRPYRVEQRDAAGNLYNARVMSWESADLGSGRYFVKNVRTTELNYDGNGTHRDTAVTTTYDDATGNVLTRASWGEVQAATDGTFTDIGSDKLVTAYTYATCASCGISGLASSELTQDQGGTKVSENRTYYDGLGFGQVIKGNPTKVEQWVLGTTYVVSEKTYNSYGLVAQVKDPRGKITTYTYDSYNLYPATITNPLGHVVSYEYDYSLGKPKRTTDPNGYVFETVYDGLGRVVEEKQPDLSSPTTLVTRISYSYVDTPLNVNVKRTDYLDGVTSVDSYTYLDGLGRTVQTRTEVAAAGQFAVVDTAYNSRGFTDKQSLPYFSSGAARTAATGTSTLYTTYIYDAVGRVTSLQNAVGTTTTSYDDWKTTVVDARGNPKHAYHDAYGRLVRVDEVNGAVYSTAYEYSGLGLLTRLTDAAGNVRSFTYNGLGRRLTAQDLHAPTDTTFGLWQYTYDAAGNLVSKLDPKGQTVSYTYDDLSRQLTEDFIGAAGTEVTVTYDTCANGKGRACSTTNAAVGRTYMYNALGNVATEVSTINSVPYTSSYTYDRQGNALAIINPDSSQVKYVFNTAGQVSDVQRKEAADAGFTSVVTSLDYGPYGGVVSQANANGTTTTNTYDSTQLYRLARKLTTNSSGLRLQDLSYTYDAVGNITRLIDASQTNAAKTVDYTYDALSRLLTATTTGAANGQNYSHSFSYDAIGNILSGPLGSYAYQGNQGASYANPHAATMVGGATLAYDTNGNLTGDGAKAYAWDYQNRLLSVTMYGGAPPSVTQSFFPTAGDGSIAYTRSTSWDTTHDAITGSSAGYTAGSLSVRVGQAGGKYAIERAFLPFDTSALPDNATITSARLKVWVDSKLNNDNDGQDFVTVVQGTQPSTAALTTADYDLASTINTPVEGIGAAERKDITTVTVGAYLTFSLNATGVGWVNKTGPTKLALREGHDVLDAPFTIIANQAQAAAGMVTMAASAKPGPSVSGYNQLILRTGEYAGTSSDPILEVIYTTPTSAVTSTYAYDASGQRVKVVTAGTTTVYPTRSYNTDGAKKTKHVFVGSAVAATLETSGTTATPHYTSTDHLTGSNVVTASAGTQEELVDYYPFGSIRLDERAGSFSEQRKFTGQEYDADTGLSYMNARYYNGTIGRFISQDPLEIAGLQGADVEKFNALITSPQNWNTYSYALNNPLRMVDPSGLLTVIVPGTNHNEQKWDNAKIVDFAKQTFNDNVIVFSKGEGWTGKNNKADREAAADALVGFINTYGFNDEEKLNIVTHSHGGNVAALLSQRLNRRIDNLVTYNVPVRGDYKFNEDNIGRHVNIFTWGDGVQQWAGGSFHVWMNGVKEFGFARRDFDDKRVVDTNMTPYMMLYRLTHPFSTPISNHTQLRESSWVWSHAVIPNIIK